MGHHWALSQPIRRPKGGSGTASRYSSTSKWPPPPPRELDDGEGLKRRVGSSEQIKTVMARPNPSALAGARSAYAIATGLTNEQLHERFLRKHGAVRS